MRLYAQPNGESGGAVRHVWRRCASRSDGGCWGDGKDKDVWSRVFAGIRGVVADK